MRSAVVSPFRWALPVSLILQLLEHSNQIDKFDETNEQQSQNIFNNHIIWLGTVTARSRCLAWLYLISHIVSLLTTVFLSFSLTPFFHLYENSLVIFFSLYLSLIIIIVVGKRLTWLCVHLLMAKLERTL